MPTLQVNVIKDEKDEFEVEFSERMCRNAEEDTLRVLESNGWQKDAEKKGVLYRDFKENEIAETLRAILVKKGVDAYAHQKHKLKPTYTLHISAQNAKKEFTKAVDELDNNWSDFKTALLKKIK